MAEAILDALSEYELSNNVECRKCHEWYYGEGEKCEQHVRLDSIGATVGPAVDNVGDFVAWCHKYGYNVPRVNSVGARALVREYEADREAYHK